MAVGQTPAAEALAALDLTLDITDGSLIVGACLLVKVVDSDGHEEMIHDSDGLSFFEETGMLAHAARSQVESADTR